MLYFLILFKVNILVLFFKLKVDGIKNFLVLFWFKCFFILLNEFFIFNVVDINVVFLIFFSICLLINFFILSGIFFKMNVLYFEFIFNILV